MTKIQANERESFLPEDLVMTDCEMTGVNPERDKLLQIAMLKMKLNEQEQYDEVGEPLVIYLKHDGKPENDFHKEFLQPVFDKCNESTVTPEQAKEQIHAWLGDLKGKVMPCGDCVPTDMDFMRHAGVIDSADFEDGKPVEGTFHYEYFEMNPLKSVARHKAGCKEEKKDLAGYDEAGVHDGLVDCRNQRLEFNHCINLLLDPERVLQEHPGPAATNPLVISEAITEDESTIETIQGLLHRNLPDGIHLDPWTEYQDGAHFLKLRNKPEAPADLIGTLGVHESMEALQRIAQMQGEEELPPEGLYFTYQIPGESEKMAGMTNDRDVDALGAFLMNLLGVTPGEALPPAFVPENIQVAGFADDSNFIQKTRQTCRASLDKLHRYEALILEAETQVGNPDAESKVMDYLGSLVAANVIQMLEELSLVTLLKGDTEGPMSDDFRAVIDQAFGSAESLVAGEAALKKIMWEARTPENRWIMLTQDTETEGFNVLALADDTRELPEEKILLVLDLRNIETEEEYDTLWNAIDWPQVQGWYYADVEAPEDAQEPEQVEVASAFKKTPGIPRSAMPESLDDHSIDDQKRKLILTFEGKALRCGTFEDFQKLLNQIMLELQLAEDTRRKVAGILNQKRVEKEYLPL